MSEELIAYSSPWRMALINLGAIIFVVMGLWMVGLFGEAPEESRRWPAGLVQLVGWSSIAFFGACAVVGIRRVLDTDVQLSVSSQGIRWRPWSEDTIPWHEIRDVSVWQYRTQKAIVLSLRHPERYPSNTYFRMLTGMSRAISGGDISISLTGLTKSFDETLAAIHEFWRGQ